MGDQTLVYHSNLSKINHSNLILQPSKQEVKDRIDFDCSVRVNNEDILTH